MSVKIKRYSTDPLIETNPMTGDTDQVQRETTVDGYTFHWGENQTRNFLDEGVGIAHMNFAAGNATGSVNVMLDTLPSGDALS